MGYSCSDEVGQKLGVLAATNEDLRDGNSMWIIWNFAKVVKASIEE